MVPVNQADMNTIEMHAAYARMVHRDAQICLFLVNDRECVAKLEEIGFETKHLSETGPEKAVSLLGQFIFDKCELYLPEDDIPDVEEEIYDYFITKELINKLHALQFDL